MPARLILLFALLGVQFAMAGCAESSRQRAATDREVQGSERRQADAPGPIKVRKVKAAIGRPAAELPGMIPIPPALRFGNVGVIAEARSYQNELKALPKDEARYLWSVYARYGTALWYGSPDSQRKMVARGMPMPEEWLAARRMSDAELKALAEAGNYKATMFVADRAVTEYLRRKDSDSARWGQREMADHLAYLNAARAVEDAVRRWKLPFAIYMLARMDSAGSTNCEAVVAAMMVVNRVWQDEAMENEFAYQAACIRDSKVELSSVSFFNARYSRLLENRPWAPH
jgi:hypothetical protein